MDVQAPLNPTPAGSTPAGSTPAPPTPDTRPWLVATKLHPPLVRSDTIRRQRLEDALSRSVATLPLTLLSAPAGYGKSTTLATLPALLPELPLAWITLDTEDNDPVRFIGIMATALQRLHPECGRSVWPLLAGGGSESAGPKRAMGALINDILTYLNAPFILVLDDLHFVTEPAVYVALEYLLDHQPPQMHLAVGTRHDPPLRLARLAARRQLAELRRPDLLFSAAEAHQLLNDTLGLSLEPQEVAALQERTEGWPAGLCLLAGPLGRMGSAADRTQFMAAVTYSERYALDFLAEEVLRDLDADLRRFLLQTSILAEMTPTLCRAVTGREDAADVLDGLYRQNLTIASLTTEAAGEPVYRHHALFARLLSRQLERELPGEIPLLHHRAAEAQATPGRAIAHYLSAELWDDAARVMAQSGTEMLHSGMSETIRTWYNALPAETQASHPQLTVLMARCEIHVGNYPAAGLLLNQARAAFAAAGDAAGEGEAYTSLITMALQNDDQAAAPALVARALELPLNPMGRVAALLGRAWVRMNSGDWAASQSDMCEALSIPRATGNRPALLLGMTYLSAAPLFAVPGGLELTERFTAQLEAVAPPESPYRLSADDLSVLPLLFRGRTDEALARAEAANSLRERLGGLLPVLGNDAPLVLAVLQTARGDLAAAGLAVDRLIQRIEVAPRSKWAFYLHGAGRSLALLGRHAEADAFAQRLAESDKGLPLHQYLRGHLTGLLALLQGPTAAAEAALDHAAALEARLPTAWIGGSARLLKAGLLLGQRRAEAALETVAPVLAEWELAGTPGCALLDGPAGLPVLRLAAQQGNQRAARLLRLFPAPIPAAASAAASAPTPAAAAPGAPSTLTEPLTQREQDVLRLIVAGRTNRQIGEGLYITEETVKTHVVHILRKLDVTSRTQAAIRGRELGL